MKKSFLFMFIGLVLGLGAPTGALLLRCFYSTQPYPACIAFELSEDRFFYLYMLVGTCLAFGSFGFFAGRDEDQILKWNVRLSGQALTDPLTGLGNHRFLHDVLKIEFRKHVTTRQPISCLIMDLDFFKRVNDQHGHPFGDIVLKLFAQIVEESIREGDIATRYGGEEFLCILPNCDEENARMVAERIRVQVEQETFRSGPYDVKLTVSIGAVTSYESEGLNYRHLIHLSDQALYEAKHRGRNQIVQVTIKPSIL